MKKVTIIGTGNVGASIAQLLVSQSLCDVVLVDLDQDLSRGKGLDLLQAQAARGRGGRLFSGSDYENSRDSDIVVVTAGISRKPKMSRDDLLRINAGIVGKVARAAYQYSPFAIFLVVTNPLDVMTYLVRKELGLAKTRVIGMAGVLDSARFQQFVAEKTGYSMIDIKTLVLGGHGDLMVPLTSYSTIAGIPLRQFLEEDEVEVLVERTKKGGAEIVSLLKTGSAYYAPTAAAVEMIRAILFDEGRIMPCSVCPEGKYGLFDLAIGLPCILGNGGVKDILELDLELAELALLKASARSVKAVINRLEELSDSKKTDMSQSES